MVKSFLIVTVSMAFAVNMTAVSPFDAIGFDGEPVTHSDCGQPCDNYVFTFYECSHESFSDPCSFTLCLEDKLYYIKCEDGAPSGGDECETFFDDDAVYGRQYQRMSPSGNVPQYCTQFPNWEQVPGQPEGDCRFVTNEGNHMSRCRISQCEGAIQETGAPRLGRDECSA